MKFLLNILTNHNSAGFSVPFNTRLNDSIDIYIFDNWHLKIIILNHLKF